MAYFILKTVHVIGAAILFGTGVGIAFFMVLAHRTRNPVIVAHTASVVAIADFLFTGTAVLLQPITGIFLILVVGYDWQAAWIFYSLILYWIAGVFWLPVLWLQLQMRDLAREAAAADAPLPPLYRKYYAIWFACGFPAFGAVILIFWLMIAQPA